MTTVRRARSADVEAIRRVGYLTWPATYLGFAPVDYVAENLARWWSVEAVERSVRDHVTYVAERDGEVVGTATVGIHDGVPVVGKIYVVGFVETRREPDSHGMTTVWAELPPRTA